MFVHLNSIDAHILVFVAFDSTLHTKTICKCNWTSVNWKCTKKIEENNGKLRIAMRHIPESKCYENMIHCLGFRWTMTGDFPFKSSCWLDFQHFWKNINVFPMCFQKFSAHAAPFRMSQMSSDDILDTLLCWRHMFSWKTTATPIPTKENETHPTIQIIYTEFKL